MKSIELALSMCDIVNIYGFTVDPGYTEWTRYFSMPRQGHNPLQGRAYYKLLECLGSLPVVDLGKENIDNIITQSSVVHMLAEYAGLHWFESWGTKKLKDLGLPIMKPHKLIKVYEDEPVLKITDPSPRRAS
ncbi:hypothetical protein MKX03_000920 [Papaver bracteatum]|nr:hypothetical protein MKX03_000920 [Papaver bracteatum]